MKHISMGRTECMICLLLAVALLVGSCAEMPEVIDETRPRTPVITAGPYILLNQQSTTEDVRFRTNTADVAGIRITGEQKLTRRYGSSTKDHVINIKSLLPEQGFGKLEILLGDHKAGDMLINTALPGQKAVIGFMGGIGVDLAKEKVAVAKLGARKLNSSVIIDGNFPQDNKLATWDSQIFAPLKELSKNSPLMFLPEYMAMMPAIAGGNSSVYWSRDIGCVHLIFLDINELKKPASREKALQWLRKDLSENTQPWAVLSLSKPLFGATRIHARAIETLGTLLETGGVDLVISGGARYYQRSVPVKSGDSGAVRYIVSGGLAASGKKPLGREYRAAASGEPHFSVLEAGPLRLDWNVYSADGMRHLDTLTVFTDGRSVQGEPSVEKMDILTDALAALTLQREVLTVAREAARAVDNPGRKQRLTFRIANPSPRNISGELIWRVAPDSAYKVEPQAVRFNLKSGFEGMVNFDVERYAKDPAAPMPVLTVNMNGIGSASQQLILSKRKYAKIYPAKSNIVIDGIMGEDSWKQAIPLKGFGVIGTGAKPKAPIDARVTYDNKGIYVIARCAANDPQTIATTAKNHDDPVHRDESVEFFIDPDNQARDYYQFAINVDGITLDRSSKLGLSWNPIWESKVTKRKDYYTVEAFIPYQALGLPQGSKPGQRWAFNISRNDYQQSAVRKDPFARSEKSKVRDKSKGVTRFNIAELAKEDLGREQIKKDKEKKKAVEQKADNKKGSGLEIVQWADTFGANDRSGLYGNIIFEAQQPPAGTAGSAKGKK